MDEAADRPSFATFWKKGKEKFRRKPSAPEPEEAQIGPVDTCKLLALTCDSIALMCVRAGAMRRGVRICHEGWKRA
jgi:hypothetical protein